MQIYRPFLSYNELGSMLDDGPSRLYDALSTVLGLEDLVGAQELLRRARLSRANGRKDAVDKLKTLRNQLAGCDDARARACLAALDARPWDLDGAERQVLYGGAPGTDGGELGRLQHLAACPVPSSPAVAEAAAALTSAAQAAIAVAGTESARALEQADLLDKALAFHRQHTAADCPVCGTPAVLGPAWEQRSDAAVRQLRAEAHAADTARRSVQEARAAAMALLAPAPAVLDEAKGLGFDADVAVVRSHWDDWASLATIEDPEELARALPERAGELEVAVTALQTAAAAEMARREDRWRPVAAAVAEWIGPARLAVAGAAAIPAITDAENWVKTASAAIREERFAPIADQAAEVWDTLRGQSNVALQRVSLGAYPQRKVTLDVTVDGVGGAALGVMSQGELHALALSLFLPRATLPASPFRFIVIDDPVQSMDPARVEGLARVLEQAAATRQVIVFTHDDRLPEVCRRLQIETQTIEVSRRPGSVVELTKVTSPIDRYLSEAAAIARTKELAETVTTRVAGAFCRMALEAACTEALVRRRLGRGERHEAVEVLVAGAGSLAEKASLALFDQEGRSPGEVRDRLGKFGPWAPEVFKRANTGSHQALSAAALGNLVDDTRRLARQLVALP